MNRSYSKIRHIQEVNGMVEKRLLSEQSEDFDFRHIVGDGEQMTQDKLKELLSAMKSQLSSFEEKHKDVLDVGKSFKNRLAQEKELENLKFYLSLSKNRNSPPTLTAGVRWPFEYKGKMPKNNRINVYVGSMRMFPQGLETPNIQEISKKIISDKIRNNSSYPKVEL